MATAAAALCAFIAPAAAGSGIPEVKAYLNGIDAYTILAPSTLFVKVKQNSCYYSLLIYSYKSSCYFSKFVCVGLHRNKAQTIAEHYASCVGPILQLTLMMKTALIGLNS